MVPFEPGQRKGPIYGDLAALGCSRPWYACRGGTLVISPATLARAWRSFAAMAVVLRVDTLATCG